MRLLVILSFTLAGMLFGSLIGGLPDTSSPSLVIYLILTVITGCVAYNPVKKVEIPYAKGMFGIIHLVKICRVVGIEELSNRRQDNYQKAMVFLLEIANNQNDSEKESAMECINNLHKYSDEDLVTVATYLDGLPRPA